jgi:hypothetical protein
VRLLGADCSSNWGFWLEKAEAEKKRVGEWKLRLEMQQARSGNTSTNTA